MCCNTLWIKSKILLLCCIVLALANILQVVGILSPEWDRFDTPYFGARIRLYQGLWTLYAEIHEKDLREGLLPQKLNTDWKASIIRLEVSALGTGVLSLILVFCTATVKALSRRRGVRVTCHILSLLLAWSSAITVIIGVQTYATAYKSILSIEAFKPVNQIPVEKYVLSWGLHICYGSSSFYILSSLLLIANTVRDVVCRSKSTVSPEPSQDGGQITPAPSGDGAQTTPAPSGDGGQITPAPSGDGAQTTPAPSGDGGQITPAPSGDGGQTTPASSGEGGHISLAPSKDGAQTTPAPSGDGGQITPAPSGDGGQTTPATSGEGGHISPAPSKDGAQTTSLGEV